MLLWQIWSFEVKQCERHEGDPPEELDPRVSPFKVTQGHRNRHRSIGPLGPTTSCFKIRKLFPPRVLNAPVQGIPLGIG